jgi:hypothetical protein
VNKSEYDTYCQVAYNLSHQAAEARRNRRAVEWSIKYREQLVDARYAPTLKQIADEKSRDIAGLPEACDEYLAAEKDLMAKSSQILGILLEHCTLARARGEEWPDPPLPDRVSLMYDSEVELLDMSKIPAKYWSVNESEIKSALKLGPVEGAKLVLKVSLKTGMRDEDFRRFEPKKAG